MVDVEAGRIVSIKGLVAQLLRGSRLTFEQLVLIGGEREVESRRDPYRGPLKHGQVGGLSRYAGTYWIALAPVPMEATRSPSVDLLWSQREE